MSDDAHLDHVHYQSLVEPDERSVDGVTVDLIGTDAIDELEPLWTELVHHHVALNGAIAFREPDDSWPRLRALYAEILAGPDAFCLLARRDGRAVGYAIVKVEGPELVWRTGDKLAELETLSIAEPERGGGLGTHLMDLVERELAARGIDDLLIGVESPNLRAQDFYERRGYAHVFTWLYGKPATMRREGGQPEAR